MNVVTFIEHANWIDAGQIVLGITVFYTASLWIIAGGGILLAGWELYEYYEAK